MKNTLRTPAKGYKNILAESLQILEASPSARMLKKEAQQAGWTMDMAALGRYDFHLDVPEKRVLLDHSGLSPEALERSSYFRSSLLVSLIRALRDIWQEKRHGGFEEHYGPENILILERARAADCDMMTVLAGWELRCEGESALWRHLIGSEEGDLAMEFSRRLEREPASAFTGSALAAAFNQWHRSAERVRACDHETLNMLDQLLQQGNRNYGAGRRELTPAYVEILSCLPDRTAYLRGLGGQILTDPLYAGLNDPINQAHFMQIIHDLKVTYAQGVPFRDKALAEKIFPGGEFTNILQGLFQ